MSSDPFTQFQFGASFIPPGASSTRFIPPGAHSAHGTGFQFVGFAHASTSQSEKKTMKSPRADGLRPVKPVNYEESESEGEESESDDDDCARVQAMIIDDEFEPDDFALLGRKDQAAAMHDSAQKEFEIAKAQYDGTAIATKTAFDAVAADLKLSATDLHFYMKALSSARTTVGMTQVAAHLKMPSATKARILGLQKVEKEMNAATNAFLAKLENLNDAKKKLGSGPRRF